jgi:NAD(P)-dependent dehydrogenase (short-subunit alcohol dehydrogenase family)
VNADASQQPRTAASLAGRVALVTGSGRGLGRAHALRLARAGAAVVVNDIGCDTSGTGNDDAPARQTVADIVAAGGRAVADGTDIGSWRGGAAAVQAALDAFGRIDVVVNNAGISGSDGHAGDDDEWLDTMMAVHLKGTLGTMGAALPLMREQGWGRVVNTVSEVALDMRLGPAGFYSMAKAAVWSATLCEAARVEGTGVTVNAIAPGARTRMNDVMYPDGEPAIDLDPDHVARVVEYLTSDAAGDVNGHIVFAASDVVREYVTWRRSDTELVARLRRELGLR